MATELVHPTALVTTPDPHVGTVLVAHTSCPTGKVLLSGGGEVSAPGAGDAAVRVTSSFPVSTTVWQTVATVTGRLDPGTAMTLRPFVLCGTP